ncbi:MAG: SH3 domain-containing protein [Cyanobacteriota bacterium]|nr:SH3 domain-containing protein [Cyanobacteriota bacterium]
MMNFSIKSSKSSWVRAASIACLVGVVSAACGTPSARNSNIRKSETGVKTELQNTSSQGNISNTAGGSVSTNVATGISNNATASANIEPPQFCVLNQARVSDPDPPLNVRNEPNVKTSEVIGTVDNGRFLSVKDEKNGWLQVSYQSSEAEVSGWVAKNRTETTCNYKKQQINFPEGGGSVQISDRHIGAGSHEYVFNASEGQTLTVTVKKGALPFIHPPNDPNRQQDLSGGGHYTPKKNVTVELPATGDYLLTFDSNFKGYDYDILVELQ